MSEVEQGYYEQDKPGDERSLYGDMIRSRDYGDQRVFPELLAIQSIGNYWKGQLTNPERSPRAHKEIDLLLNRASFEIVMRTADMVNLSRQQWEEESAWTEHESSNG